MKNSLRIMVGGTLTGANRYDDFEVDSNVYLYARHLETALQTGDMSDLNYAYPDRFPTEAFKRAIADLGDPAILDDIAADPVNHPPHYTQHPSGVECIQITEHMGFNLGNALKYIWRADLKGAAVQDLEKAMFYLKREVELRSTNQPHAQLGHYEQQTHLEGEQ